MSAAENKKLIQDIFDALSRGDPAPLLGALAEDVSYTVKGTTRFSGSFTKQELLDKVLGPLMSMLEGGLTFTLKRIIADGDTVAAEVSSKATTKAGKAYNNSYCMVYHLANGQVKEATEYFDTQLVTSVFGS